ncbi:LytTR family DNA-binding domain-containing protein [Aestuariirhabdus sp. Z084]|uniref:LytR/AlgR family response regulator transcription factor n=1 Tax=Aestuariirhabdus haliotis TaxID=2918751 RepID=UPI00201B3F5D|nr:LytTR family DNA-binding domain-containing protein [Aestuariirhabdus haliotis]MCL6416130.1 LytTR family DNA-binding domain-containing protein [Aestuariirhabdus haliotis]MCL6420113.1 LytTR family DNA-binding domain-containing protein [Aestuariirhabdus haliotis]
MKVLLVDDEPLARDRLRRMVDDCDGYEVLDEEACNGQEAIALVQRFNPDVVLMDIRMPGMDGMEVARHLCALRTPPAVIFCTAYGEYAIEAFEVQAVGYLLKPVRQEALLKALESASVANRIQLAALSRQQDDSGQRCHISARTHKGIELIPLADVICFVADNKYVTVRHTGGEVLIDDTLKELEAEFGERFARIHRNALVACAAIDRLERTGEGHYQLFLSGQDEPLQVSRRHVAATRRLMQKL